MSQFNDTPDDFDPDWVSKSQIKREMTALQELGARLLSIKDGELKRFPISDEMRRAIEEEKRIKSHEAKRRHMQYIGKLMRDEDIDGIQRALDMLDPASELYLRLQAQAEQWRERLIRTKEAEAEWIALNPNTDIQPFRAMVRAARKEQPDDSNAPIAGGKNSKKLLQTIKKVLFN